MCLEERLYATKRFDVFFSFQIYVISRLWNDNNRQNMILRDIKLARKTEIRFQIVKTDIFKMAND